MVIALAFVLSTDISGQVAAFGAGGSFLVVLVGAVLKLMDDRTKRRAAEHSAEVVAEEKAEAAVAETAAEASAARRRLEGQVGILMRAFEGVAAVEPTIWQPGVEGRPGILERIGNLESGQQSTVDVLGQLKGSIDQLVAQGQR